MKRFIYAATIAVSSLFSATAVERGSFGIGVECYSLLDMFNSSSYMYSASSMPPLASISLRYSPSILADIDISYGFNITSEVKRDSAAKTDAYPASVSHTFSVGGVVNPFVGEKAILGVYGRFIGNISTAYNSIGSYPDYEYLYYTRFTPKIGFGVEPSYYFSKNFSIYFRTGIGIIFVPATRYEELKTGGDPGDKNDYTLKSRNDSKVNVGTDGITLGLRVLF